MNKFSEGLSKVGATIKDNQKPLLYIGGAIAVVAIGVVVVRGISGGVSGILKPFKNVKGSSGFNEEPVDLSKATITEAQAKTYANQLFNAMKNSGTNVGAIKAIIQAVNAEDYKMIYNAFGLKSYYNFGEPTLLSILTGWDDIDLNEWFKRELNKTFDSSTYALIEKRNKEAGLIF